MAAGSGPVGRRCTHARVCVLRPAVERITGRRRLGMPGAGLRRRCRRVRPGGLRRLCRRAVRGRRRVGCLGLHGFLRGRLVRELLRLALVPARGFSPDDAGGAGGRGGSGRCGPSAPPFCSDMCGPFHIGMPLISAHSTMTALSGTCFEENWTLPESSPITARREPWWTGYQVNHRIDASVCPPEGI